MLWTGHLCALAPVLIASRLGDLAIVGCSESDLGDVNGVVVVAVPQ